MMLKEYEITFKGRTNGCMETAKLTVIASSPSRAIDLFNSYAVSEDVKKLEILEIKLIKGINSCLIERVGE